MRSLLLILLSVAALMPTPVGAEPVTFTDTTIFTTTGTEDPNDFIASRDETAIMFLSSGGGDLEEDYVEWVHNFTIPPGSIIASASIKLYLHDDNHEDNNDSTTWLGIPINYEKVSVYSIDEAITKVHYREVQGNETAPPIYDVVTFPIDALSTLYDGRYQLKARSDFVELQLTAGDFYIDRSELSITYEQTWTYFQTVPFEGAQGAQITITGAGPVFGTKKGKVLIGGVAAKVESWLPGEIVCSLKKTPPAETYDVEVRPKGVEPLSEPGAFTVRTPSIALVNPGNGSVGTLVTITGDFFGVKKGKVYLEQGEVRKAGKVKSWEMNEIDFLAPKGLSPGTCNIVVVNKAGTTTMIGAFTVE